jgi:outer membrane scaffolding protein for murein synthesis (MipA/OmpV family)
MFHYQLSFGAGFRPKHLKNAKNSGYFINYLSTKKKKFRFRFTWGNLQPDCLADRPVTDPSHSITQP